ncbi:MAG: TetR/AcrR family transcriptional regulator [Cyclobacteriaceae bacterium]|nr:TetR/AcrR family transcriptional regulator [Cyclobacteriaceae bacterium SS2]
MKQKILEGAETLFMRYGVRSVSMDDVAREVSVSKKTIYQHFNHKDDLVTEAARNYLTGEMKEVSEITEQAADALEELFLLSRCIRQNISRVNPSLLYDLQKYHPEAWEVFKDYKDNFIMGKVMSNLIRGKKENLYRAEINEKILSIMRVEQVQLIFDERAFPKSDFDFVDVQVQIFDHFIHGLLSDNGRKYYKEYQKKHIENQLK